MGGYLLLLKKFTVSYSTHCRDTASLHMFYCWGSCIGEMCLYILRVMNIEAQCIIVIQCAILYNVL